VNAVMNLRVHRMLGNLTGFTTGGHSSSAKLHRVSLLGKWVRFPNRGTQLELFTFPCSVTSQCK
jgi:hypothetical protein